MYADTAPQGTLSLCDSSWTSGEPSWTEAGLSAILSSLAVQAASIWKRKLQLDSNALISHQKQTSERKDSLHWELSNLLITPCSPFKRCFGTKVVEPPSATSTPQMEFKSQQFHFWASPLLMAWESREAWPKCFGCYRKTQMKLLASA